MTTSVAYVRFGSDATVPATTADMPVLPNTRGDARCESTHPLCDGDPRVGQRQSAADPRGRVVSLMSFLDSEKTDIRRFCGYPAYGGSAAGFENWRFYQAYGLLEFRMNNLSCAEEAVVRRYLANLNVMETAVPLAAQNLDTDQRRYGPIIARRSPIARRCSTTGAGGSAPSSGCRPVLAWHHPASRSWSECHSITSRTVSGGA